jgi:hypothetical protein
MDIYAKNVSAEDFYTFRFVPRKRYSLLGKPRDDSEQHAGIYE